MAFNRLIRKTSVSKFYRAWVNMKTRCNNPNVRSYKRYGGRGITVCNKWKTFDGFIKDMLPTYKDELTLDRINNNGDYCKGNCRWATPKQQANNTRNIDKSLKITFNNKTKRLSEWAKELGIKRTTLGMRIQTYNWSIEKAFTTI